MSTDPKIEAYLSRLDRALGQVSVSDRTDIVMEIKSHIYASLEKHPEQNIQAALNALGEPETVANRYLMERGLKPGKTPKSPMMKWLTIGFLGTFAIIAATFLVIIWKFTPIISVDEEKEKVEILGGVISIDGKKGTVNGLSGLDNIAKGGEFYDISGTKALDAQTTDSLDIRFSTGDFEVSSMPGTTLSWECKISGTDAVDPEVILQDKVAVLDLKYAALGKCKVGIPESFKVKIDGSNGKLSLIKPMADVEANLINGKVEIQAVAGKLYNYDLQVKMGRIDTFESSGDPQAIKIAVHLDNGVIDKGQ